jgi:chorismate mutase
MKVAKKNLLKIRKRKKTGKTGMKQMNLSEISQRLESFEETIVFTLIDRAQFAVNRIIYEPGKSGFKDAGNASLLELRLAAQENIDAQFGKFHSPEERPFFSRSAPKRKAMVEDREILIDDCSVVNLTKDIMAAYRSLIPLLSPEGDDGHYGSSVELDVYALQAISRRVHFGSLYAAECKFRSDPEGFGALIDANDEEGLITRLTRKEVEEKTIERIREKTQSTQTLVNLAIRRAIKPEVVVDFYRNSIIPFTKKGQALYLLNRKRKPRHFLLHPTPPAQSEPNAILHCHRGGGQRAAASAC